MAKSLIAKANFFVVTKVESAFKDVPTQDGENRMQGTHPTETCAAPPLTLGPGVPLDHRQNDFWQHLAGGTALNFFDGKPSLALTCVAQFSLIQAVQPSATQKALNGLLWRAFFWTLTLLNRVWLLGGQPLNHKAKPAGTVVRIGGTKTQARIRQPLG